MKLRPDEIEPKPENPFERDLLNRKEYTNILTQIIKHTEGEFTLSINADWGYGKTTFVKMWEKVLQNAGYQTIYFNAWESDFVADPMMALIDGIIEAINTELTEDKKTFLKALTQSIVEMAKLVPSLQSAASIAQAIIKGVETCKDETSDMEKYRGIKNLVKDFKDKLSKYAKSVGGVKPLIIFVDELDRCRPDYAVQMLERIKHFFYAKNIVFVLSIDKHVMCESVRAVYGGLDIDTEAYLRRFIDLEFDLPEPNIADFIHAHCEQKQIAKYFKGYFDVIQHSYYGKDHEGELRYALIECFESENRSLRDVEKYFSRLLILLNSQKLSHKAIGTVVFTLYLYMFHQDIYVALKQMRLDIPDMWQKLEKLARDSHLDPTSNQYGSYLALVITSFASYIVEKETHDGGRDPIYQEIRGNAKLSWFSENERLQEWLKQEVSSGPKIDMQTLSEHIELMTILFQDESEEDNEKTKNNE